MRALTLIFLCLAFTGPAFAQLQPNNPPLNAPAAATSPKGTGQLNANGKIQIGYDKRADYPNIKQPVSGSAAKPAETNALNAPTAANVQNPQNLNGNILNSAQGQRKNTAPTGATFVTGSPAPVAPSSAAAPAKPRSDSALRSDSSTAREAADKARAEALIAAQKAGASPTGSLPALPRN